MKGLEIRLAKPDEINAIVELLQPMWIMHGSKESELLNETYLKNLDARKYLKTCFDPNSNEKIYVAVEADEIIGCVRAEIIDLEGMFNQTKGVYVDDLVVKESYRKRGIGQMLVAQVEEFAKNHNIRIMKTRVYDFNEKAQKLFRKAKYRPVYSEQYKVLEEAK